jgi:hypothetical protein
MGQKFHISVYPFNLLGVAGEVPTGVYKQRPTVMSPK